MQKNGNSMSIKEIINKNNSHQSIFKDKINIQLIRLVINICLSLILFVVIIYVLITYNPQWRIFCFLTSWSYILSIYYIISVTIIDFFSIALHINLNNYNNFIRNYYIRICTPFSITSVFIFWELVLLGEDFQEIGDNARKIGENIFLNGVVLLFLFFDMFAAPHIYKYNRINDIIILTLFIAFYYLIVTLSKYLKIYEPYEFMKMSDVRQIIGVWIICYVLLLNGYLVFDLLSYQFFLHKNKY